jgi:hypothetical protein
MSVRWSRSISVCVCVCVCVCVRASCKERERDMERKESCTLSLPPSLPPLLYLSLSEPRETTIDEAVPVPNGLLQEHRPFPFAF